MSRNECEGITFLQTQDIVCDAGYTPIGYQGDNDHSYFRGTYDGQDHTASGITVTRTGNTSTDKYIGLFGCIYEGTVQNVVLANSTFTGYERVGGIAGYNSWGTVRNCRVESSVTIKGGYGEGSLFGGVVGYLVGTEALISGCVSAATINGNSQVGYQCGGIVGSVHHGTLKDCLYIGTSITGTNYVGSIAGDKNGATLSNNYYTAINLGGVGAYTGAADQEGARRARTITLGEGISLGGSETTYDVSGITAYGSTAIGYGRKIYSGAGQTLTLNYTGTVPAGYTLEGYRVNGKAIDGNSFTMPASNVTVTATLTKNELTLADNSSNDEAIAAAAASGKVYEVTLSGRTLYKDGAWNTLCLPFDVTISGSVLDGAVVKTLSSSGYDSETGTLTLNFTDELTEIEAGKPYIVKWDGDGTQNIVSPAFEGVSISSTPAVAETVGSDWVGFVGTYSPAVIYEDGSEKHNLYLGTANKLYYPTQEGSQVNPFRAYFQLKNGLTAGEPSTSQQAPARAFVLNFFDDGSAGDPRPHPRHRCGRGRPHSPWLVHPRRPQTQQYAHRQGSLHPRRQEGSSEINL